MTMKLMLLFVPLSLLLRYVFHASMIWVFVTSLLAIIPLADLLRHGTEHLARRLGPAIGGLLNVTFGNVAEMILALFVLIAGKTEVVKAQITGSIIGNSLLGLGLAIVAGTWNRDKQSFKPERTGLLSSLLILSMVALLVPALFDYTERSVFHGANPQHAEENLSLCVSVVLILMYVANLVYTLVTHRDVFAFDDEEEDSHPAWPLWKSIGLLLIGTVAVSVESELVSHTFEATAAQFNISPFFLGLTLLAVVGNASEYVAGVYFARRNRMGFVLTITVGSTIQVALLVAPLLVLISYFLGHPMNLVFSNPLELIAIASVAFAVNTIAQDGQTTWFEGLLLLALYILFALAFFFATPPVGLVEH